MSLINDRMTAIQYLDPEAHICFSQFTKMWYVASRLEIKDGDVLRLYVSHHADTPEAAVDMCFFAITNPGPGRWVVTNVYPSNRGEWVWDDEDQRWYAHD